MSQTVIKNFRIESIERSDLKRGLSYECDESMPSIRCVLIRFYSTVIYGFLSNEPRLVAQLAALKESSDRSSGPERRLSLISGEEMEELDTKVLEPITLKK